MERVTIDGLSETVQALKTLEPKMSRKLVRKGIRAGARNFQGKLRSKCPVKTGRARRSIKVRGGRSGKGIVSVNVGASAQDFGQAFYLAFNLWGHKQGKRKLGDSRKTIPGHDFFSEVFEADHEEVIEIVRNTIIDGIADLLGGGE